MLLFLNEDRENGDRYLVMGRLIKDAEFKTVGAKSTPLLTLKVSVGFEEDLVTVKLWSADALQYNGLKKGATIFADTRESAREYQGKIYKDYTANFIMSADEVRAVKPKGARTVEPESPDTFVDIPSDDLPF